MCRITKWFLICIFSYQLYVISGKSECEKYTESSAACYKKEFDKYMKDDEKWRNHEINIDRCFNDSHCESPTYDRNPLSGLPKIVRQVGRRMKDEWANTSNAVKQCVRQRLAERVGEEMINCMAKKSIDNATFAEFVNSTSHDEENAFVQLLMGNEKSTNKSSKAAAQMKKRWIAMINVVHSLRKCNESNSKQAADVETCLKKEYSAGKKVYCGNATTCSVGQKNSSNADCQKKVETIYRAACQCKQEKMRSLVAQVDEVRNSEDVSLYNLIQALSEGYNVSDYLAAVRECYGAHDEKVPRVVNVALSITEQLMKSGGSKNRPDSRKNPNEDKDKKKESFAVDKDTLDAIRDILVSQYFSEEECEPCV